MSYQDLLDTIKQNNLIVDEQILKAVFDFAKQAHQGQVRQTGEPYTDHLVEVAAILADLHQDQTTLVSALLHDVLDETTTTSDQLAKHFGNEVADLVSGVSQIGRVKIRGSINKIFTENVRKMFISMAKDIRVILIRLADRLHNMRTLSAVPISKQKRIALETLDIYAPLAERLGMGQIKGELEDLAFPYVYPKEYEWLMGIADPYIEEADKITDEAIQLIKEKLSQNKLDVDVSGRPKRKYSLYKKLLRPEIDKDINKIYDLSAIRVITKSKPDCYAVLGLVHDLWQPVPYIGISDFIAVPKPNGYQSLHTKIFDHKGHIVEVQIRSEEMHAIAEYGAATHALYSEAKALGASDENLQKGIAFNLTSKMAWVKQLAIWQQDLDLKLDVLSERIYVFSPKGDVYDLPKGATPVDFAFAVHTDLGSHIQGAKVNQKIVALTEALKSGDMVEIIKSKESRRPNRDWLQTVKTAKARNKITKFRNSSPN